MHLHSDLQNSSCWEPWVDPAPTANEVKLRDNLSVCSNSHWVKLSCLLTTHLWIVASQFSVDSFSVTMSAVPHNPNNNLCAKSTYLYLLSINEAKEELSQRLTSEKILTEIILSFDSRFFFVSAAFAVHLNYSSPFYLGFSFSNPPPWHHCLNTWIFTDSLDTNATSWLHCRISSTVINISCASLLMSGLHLILFKDKAKVKLVPIIHSLNTGRLGRYHGITAWPVVHF